MVCNIHLESFLGHCRRKKKLRPSFSTPLTNSVVIEFVTAIACGAFVGSEFVTAKQESNTGHVIPLIMFHSSGLLSHPNGLSSMYLAYTPSYPRLAPFHFKLAISLQTGSIPWMKFPFLMGIHGKTTLWMKCLLFTRLRLCPPGIRTGRPFIEQVLGLK